MSIEQEQAGTWEWMDKVHNANGYDGGPVHLIQLKEVSTLTKVYVEFFNWKYTST